MKVLLTGATGQLGRALLNVLPPAWEVVSCSRNELDLSNPFAIGGVIRHIQPDLVFNAAAYTAVDRAENDEATAMAINAGAVGALASALGETGGRLIHVSTDFVFDGTSSSAYSPDAPRNPMSVYGRSKAAGEDLAGPNALTVRTSWVYAAGGANFVRTMLRLMRERDRIGVVADQIGAPTWATGLAQTLVALAKAGAVGTYHHRDAGVASWYDFAVAIAEEAFVRGLITQMPLIDPIATADYPTPARRPAFSVLDDSATRTLLGTPPVHWRTNLRAMLDEERQLD